MSFLLGYLKRYSNIGFTSKSKHKHTQNYKIVQILFFLYKKYGTVFNNIIIIIVVVFVLVLVLLYSFTSQILLQN